MEKELSIEDILNNRDYVPPIIHLEWLNKNDLELSRNLLSAFEMSGVAFGMVVRNRDKKNQLNLHTIGIMSKDTKLEMLEDVARQYKTKPYIDGITEITLN